MMIELEALRAAKAAGDAEALRIWERDEKQDRGSCGDAMLEFDKRSKLFKAAVASGEFRFSDAFVVLPLPEGIRSQNADIYQGQKRAFRNKLIELGYEKAIKRFWTYID
jgi:hypothetical protein